MSQRDIFNRQQQEAGGVLTSDSLRAVISSGGQSWVGALIQNFSASYAKPSQPIYELGSNRVYMLDGRPMGQMSIGRIVGLSHELPVEQALFDACSTGGTLTIRADHGNCDGNPIDPNGKPVIWTFKGLRANSYAIASSTQGMLVSEEIGLTFTMLVRSF
jgi:hypothetical protein